jgi:hypothetical protein
MDLPRPRGPLSRAVLASLAGPAPEPQRLPEQAVDLADLVDLAAAALDRTRVAGGSVLTDEDVELTLWTLYELHYRGFAGVDDGWEWDPGMLAVRRTLEERLLAELRSATDGWVRDALDAPGDLPSRLFDLTETMPGAPLSAYVQREASHAEMLEYLVLKSAYHLKESDPQSFVLPRLGGQAKVALAELQYDEYGAGRPHALHQRMFAEALDAAGLSSDYGAYVDVIPGSTLAVTNVMSLFALRRGLAAAAMGHLGAFEATSSEPCRKVAGGCRRLGMPDAVAAYYDEHVEADAVHEQLAFRDICGSIVEERPEAGRDLLFGAAAYLHSEAVAGQATLDAWRAGRSSLLNTRLAEPVDTTPPVATGVAS